MCTVIILLSAYNGERFIEEQLVSLRDQTGVNFSILVRDDGSTDATPTLLQRWQEEGVLTWYRGENMGWANSFMDLILHAPEADYYAFCDHDDIWLPDKLSIAIQQLERCEEDKKLYCSNMFSYRDGVNEGEVYSQPPVINIYTAMVKSVTAGCTMVFSRELRQCIAQHPPQFVFAHDYWTYQVAVALGKVIYDPKPYILYRQHENNQIGFKHSFADVWKRRIVTLKTLFSQHEREKAAQELLTCHGDAMSEEVRCAVEEMAFYRKNPVNRIRLFFDRRYSMGHLSNNLWLRMRILLGCV